MQSLRRERVRPQPLPADARFHSRFPVVGLPTTEVNPQCGVVPHFRFRE